MCTVDWAALGIWVQAAVLAVGARIAYVQLSRFNDNERVKNTLDLQGRFHATTSYLSILKGTLQTTTIASAMVQLSQAGANIPRWTALRTAVFDNTASQQQKLDREQTFNAIVLALNFFAWAGNLDKRNLLDSALFLDMFGDLVAQVYDYGADLSVAEENKFARTLADFKALADKSRAL